MRCAGHDSSTVCSIDALDAKSAASSVVVVPYLKTHGEDKDMIKQLCVAILILLFFICEAGTKEIKGIEMPDTLNAGDDTLVLNGAGVRKKYLVDVYVGGLYLKEKCHDPVKIIADDEPMAIRLHIISGIVTSEKMAASTLEGFEASTGGNIAPLKDKIDTFISVFKDNIKKGDVYDLVYLPGIGVQSYKNGTLVTTVPGLDFKKALFGIWLCEKPTINLDLKKGLLGQ